MKGLFPKPKVKSITFVKRGNVPERRPPNKKIEMRKVAKKDLFK